MDKLYYSLLSIIIFIACAYFLIRIANKARKDIENNYGNKKEIKRKFFKQIFKYIVIYFILMLILVFIKLSLESKF